MTLAAFAPLTAAEQAVIDGLGTGHVTVLGDGTLPGPEAGDDRRVRASLIRWLALGAPGDGAVRLHEKGLRIAGALVVSDGQADPARAGTTPGLDLEGCKLDHDLLLEDCRFQDTPVLRGARLQTLNLQGSVLPGLQGDRLEARGDVFLRGVVAAGEVRLVGARIGRHLVCEGGRFENPDGKALTADSARVEGTFFWRAGSRADGAIDLQAARLDTINDDPDCWAGSGDLLLNRCTYGAFTGQGINADDRIHWLDLQEPARYGNDFWPQPWEHCAHVLREMGHPEDARQVLIAKEKRQRAALRLSVISGPLEGLGFKGVFGAALDMAIATIAWILMPIFLAHYLILALRDWLLGALIAYGHRPLRAVWWLAGMWLLGAVLFGVAHGDGGFKPNNAVILSKPEWAQCAERGDRRGDHPSTLACYREQPEAAGYPAFNAALYSLDTLVPVVDLEVQDYWVPDERVSPAARYYLWGHIAMGWFLALLAVAGVSGLIDTRATKD
jgi:hypothetical protein